CRQQPALFAGKVYAQILPDPELHYSVAPQSIRLCRGHLAMVYHPGIGITEVGIARALHRRDQGNGSIHMCAAHNGPSAAVTIAAWTVKDGMFVDHAGLLRGKRRNNLKYRTRRVLG